MSRAGRTSAARGLLVAMGPQTVNGLDVGARSGMTRAHRRGAGRALTIAVEGAGSPREAHAHLGSN
jgi:hypothetical protein